MMSNKTKTKIKGLVAEYVKMFPAEYDAVCDYVRERRKEMQDERLGVTDGDHTIERLLFEIPETLDGMFNLYLSSDEYKEFRGLNGEEAKKSARWFAKTFPEFRIPTQI